MTHVKPCAQIEAGQNACAILGGDALTRELLRVRLVHSEPGSVQAGVRGARNSPAEQLR
jgi:hypothetical protein